MSQRLSDVPEDAMPAYFRAADDLARDWVSSAECLKPNNQANINLWTGNRKTQIPYAKYDEARHLACLICEGCPVQWECVAFAIRSGDRFTVAAVLPSWRTILVDEEPQWEALLEVAKAEAVSVADVIRGVCLVSDIVLPSDYGSSEDTEDE